MKTKTQLSALILIISMMFASNTFANKKMIDFEDEAYIDDIPFNTEWVVDELMTLSIDFEDEAYVDDIPFNTANVVSNYKYKVSTAITYEMEEEKYVDDIPFNTLLIAELAYAYEMEDEDYVNDIPFNTYTVAMESLTDSHFIALRK